MLKPPFIPLSIFIAGTAIAWGLTCALLFYARSRSLIDIPNPRSSHQFPTPRGGGLAIVIVFLGAVTILYIFGLLAKDAFLALCGGSVLVAGIGFWDDHDSVAPGFRLLVHGIAAIWSLVWIGGFPAFSLGGLEIDSGIFGYPIGLLFLVWMLNLFNFMDGSDGIAGSEALFICLAAAFLCSIGPNLPGSDVDVWILLVLASGCLGFLLWNWPPAAIFMGDVGSGFLGFILGLLALMTSHQEVLNIWCWLLLFGVFIVDATVTLLRRILRGEPWTQAHCSHAYQHAVRRFQSHRSVALAVTEINILWLLPLACLSQLWPAIGFICFCVAATPLIVLAYRYDAGVL
ncbi:MAG: MraY family glycosyltransferase [Methylococcales bacterium]